MKIISYYPMNDSRAACRKDTRFCACGAGNVKSFFFAFFFSGMDSPLIKVTGTFSTEKK